jgi:hypothetical protein
MIRAPGLGMKVILRVARTRNNTAGDVRRRKRIEMTDDLHALEVRLTQELEEAIAGLGNDDQTYLSEIQPSSAIVRCAAIAAAQVLLAFERGYRMSDPEPEAGQEVGK